VRQRAVDYLREHAGTMAAFHTNENISWSNYLGSMQSTSTFGDHLTLHAAACTYGVNVLILDATDESKCLAISCCTDSSAYDHTHTNAADLLASELQIVLLGYYNEDKGAHYVSLASESKQCLHDTAARVLASPPGAASLSAVHGTHNVEPNEVAEQQAKLNDILAASDSPTTAQDQMSVDTPFGVKINSWREWKRSRPWLSCQKGKVFCTACQNMLGKTVVFVDSAETRED